LALAAKRLSDRSIAVAQLSVVPEPIDRYVGTVVGESTSSEFRLAVAHEMIREQDIIAVDTELRSPDGGEPAAIRIWAKVQRIERLNPLFPIEAGHELAATRTNPLDTVLSLSREMVTAVCQVLGAEKFDASQGGKLDHLRYPAQPATAAYRPDSPDIARVVLGDLGQKQHRGLDIATLSNRDDVDVLVDGHAIVTRHLAILAMTGSGKSWTARRIIEQLAAKHYPIVIFDPHGDYAGLADVLPDVVDRYFAAFPLFDEDSDTVAKIIDSLGYELSPAMEGMLAELFRAAGTFLPADTSADEVSERVGWLANAARRPELLSWGLARDLWLLAYLAEAAELILGAGDHGKQEADYLETTCWPGFSKLNRRDAATLSALKKRTLKAAAAMRRMENTNRKIASVGANPLPTDRAEMVKYGRISVVALAGYSGEFQAMIYELVARSVFDARVQDALPYPVLLVLEEAHNFAPASPLLPAEKRSITTTKQIAQEGRKFGVGLVLISQRPSRLDETTLSQCNSYIIMRMSNPADQNYIRRVIETLGDDEAKMLPDLDIGEALLSGQLINFPVLVRIKEPESKGEREEEDAFEALAKAHREATAKVVG
jgi:hypothetical protein